MGLVDFEQMWSTDKELPYLGREEEPHGTWVALGEFQGDAIPRKANCDPRVGEIVSGTWEGLTALTVVGEDVLAIVAPKDLDAPAVWFWVTPDGISGFHGGAAARGVTISGEGWCLRLRQISRLDRPCWVRTLRQDVSLETPGDAILLDVLRGIGLPETSPSALGQGESGGIPSDPPEEWVEKLTRKRVPISGAILQPPLESPGRGVHNLRSMGRLGIGCALSSGDRAIPNGIPFSEFREDALGSWVGLGMFAGAAELLDEDGELHSARRIALGGTCALTLTDERLLAVLDSDEPGRELWRSHEIGIDLDQADQSVWISAPGSSITLEASGQQGVLSKRPVHIVIRAGEWELHLRDVLRLTRPCTRETASRRNSAQPRAENSLLAALTA